MYILDTNAFYKYLDRRELGLNDAINIKADIFGAFIDCRIDKVLPASSYVEALARFREDIEKVELINDFIKRKNLRLFNNIQYQCFSDKDYSMALGLSKYDYLTI